MANKVYFQGHCYIRTRRPSCCITDAFTSVRCLTTREYKKWLGQAAEKERKRRPYRLIKKVDLPLLRQKFPT